MEFRDLESTVLPKTMADLILSFSGTNALLEQENYQLTTQHGSLITFYCKFNNEVGEVDKIIFIYRDLSN